MKASHGLVGKYHMSYVIPRIVGIAFLGLALHARHMNDIAVVSFYVACALGYAWFATGIEQKFRDVLDSGNFKGEGAATVIGAFVGLSVIYILAVTGFVVELEKDVDEPYKGLAIWAPFVAFAMDIGLFVVRTKDGVMGIVATVMHVIQAVVWVVTAFVLATKC